MALVNGRGRALGAPSVLPRRAIDLSYLLFDGGYASELMALGYADARAQEEAIVRLIDPILRTRQRALPPLPLATAELGQTEGGLNIARPA